MAEEEQSLFAAFEMHSALGLGSGDVVFAPPNPEQYFRVIDGKLTFIGTEADAKKFAVLQEEGHKMSWLFATRIRFRWKQRLAILFGFEVWIVTDDKPAMEAWVGGIEHITDEFDSVERIECRTAP